MKKIGLLLLLIMIFSKNVEAASLELTVKEKEYLRTHPVVTVGYIANWSPIEYQNQETGAFSGITADVLKLVEKKSGLQFRYLPIPAKYRNPVAFLKDKKTDMLAGITQSIRNKADRQLILSEPYLDSSMVLVGKEGEPFSSTKPMKLAIRKRYKSGQEYIARSYPAFVLMPYETTKACIEAVNQGEAQLTLENIYIMHQWLRNPLNEKLAILPVSGEEEVRGIGFLADTAPELVSIINKALLTIKKKEINQCIIANTISNNYHISFFDFILYYQRQLLAFLLIAGVCLYCLGYIVYQKKKNMAFIKESQMILKNVTDNINGGVVMLVADEALTITYVNDGFLQLIGYTREEYEQIKDKIGLSYIYPEDLAQLKGVLQQKIKMSETIVVEFRLVSQAGWPIPILFRGKYAVDKLGRPFFYCVIVDISEQKKMLRQLVMEKERYRIVLEHSESIIFEMNSMLQIIYCSPRYEEKFGQKDWNQAEMIYPDDRQNFADFQAGLIAGKSIAELEVRVKKIDGTYLWCHFRCKTIKENNQVMRIIGKIDDIEEQKKQREFLKEQSERDGLTGLYRKMTFIEKIEKILGKECLSGALCFIDLDYFKEINDSLGHLVGDQVLQEVANKLMNLCNETDLIGRFGGDEFCIFWRDMTDADILAERAKTICLALKQCYRGENEEYCLSASIGIACFPQDGQEILALLEKADQALYQAKEQGRDQYIIYFSPPSVSKVNPF